MGMFIITYLVNNKNSKPIRDVENSVKWIAWLLKV